jgi:hypothetical protein
MVDQEQYWRNTLAYLDESFRLVEPLYQIEKSGKLREGDGKRFIEDRLLTAAAMLAGVWDAAYRGAHIDEFRVKRLLERYPREPGRKKKRAADAGQIRTGMNWDAAIKRLETHGATVTADALRPPDDLCNFAHYALPDGPVINLVGRNNEQGVCRVAGLFLSNETPKSWKSKLDPERVKFFDSFRAVDSYRLK